MARVSHFTEEFKLSSSSTSTGPNTMAEETVTESQPETKFSPSCMQKLAAKTKKVISTPVEAVRRLGLHYKHDINQLLASNLSEDSDYASSSTTIGDEIASEEELMRQAERNYLDYVFYIGPSNSLITSITRKSSNTNVTQVEEDSESRCPDASTLWAEAYIMSDSDSCIERIEENMSDHLYGVLSWEIGPEREILENQIFNDGLRYPRKYHH